MLYLSTFLVLLGAATAHGEQQSDPADDPAYRGWTFSLGQFDYLDDDFRSGEAGVEYRFRPIHLKRFFRWKNIPLVPMVGVAATSEDAYWGYVGLRYDWWLNEKWVVTPSFSAGLYEKGDRGKDLGGPVEFRSAIEVARQFSPSSRVGILFYHLSNSRIYSLNPGSESLLLVWSLGR